ncbi:MAG: ATP-dependent zinc protease [Planctomycetota bacterium]|nr:MAG: ATP-dependent zinc protease [Planctomycetota bacterium]
MKKPAKAEKVVPTIGWREWIALPNLGIKQIKAKVDTGARSSALHAVDLETFKRHGRDFVRFKVHPEQRNSKRTVIAEAEVLEYRKVKSSGGHQTRRPVILTSVSALGQTWEVELTLVSRDEMGFRMLLGREAIRRRMIVDPGRSFLNGRPKKKKAKKKKAKKKKVKKKKPTRVKRTR